MGRPVGYVRISEFTATVLVMWVFYGLLILAGGFTHTWSPSDALARIPTVLEFVIGVFITGGGVAALFGALSDHSMESDRWVTEITGLIVGASGWLTAGLAAILLNPVQPLAYTVAFFMCTAAVWRALRVAKMARHTRDISRRYGLKKGGDR